MAQNGPRVGLQQHYATLADQGMYDNVKHVTSVMKKKNEMNRALGHLCAHIG